MSEACLVWLFVLQTVSHNAYHQDPYAQEFGIRISNQLAQVEARILPAPRVCFHTLKISCIANLCNPDVLCMMQFVLDCLLIGGHACVQLKYHDTGKEKDCLPQVGQWNMMNKVSC